MGDMGDGHTTAAQERLGGAVSPQAQLYLPLKGDDEVALRLIW